MKLKSKNCNALICSFISLLLLLSSVEIDTKAAVNNTEISSYSEDILNFVYKETKSSNTQDFIDSIVTENAAGTYDWYAFSLIQSANEIDFTNYSKALETNASKNTSAGAVEKERFALILASLNTGEAFIKSTLDTCPGALGLMSYIYALHLINNGYTSSAISKSELIKEILEYQTSNAGWSLTGKGSDTDVTAMALQALAPYYSTNADVKIAVDGGLNWLSSVQQANGGYKSYDVENPESCAQVIIALCSLGISPFTDSRFIKNGKSCVDAMLSFRLENGSFKHTVSGEYNEKATEQALTAFIALQRYLEGKSPLYIFSVDENETNIIYAESIEDNSIQSDSNIDITDSTTDCNSENNKENQDKDFKLDIKTLIISAAVLLLIVAVIIALISLKKNKKRASNTLFVLIPILILSVYLLCADIKSPDNYYSIADISAGENTVIVTMSISCDTIKEHSTENNYIPTDGVILPQTQITLEAGSTVYDCLIYAAKKYNIQIENDAQTGTDTSKAYISGINYLYEFDYGELSGWMYFINGESASVGCGEQELSSGDNLEWNYTCNLGDDIT